jgi:predicted solute-binding protein
MGIQDPNYETQITPTGHKVHYSHERRKPQQGNLQHDSTHQQDSDGLNAESSLAKDQLDHASAILLIGDPALKFQDPNFPHVLDLAEAWQEQHQCPIVFAVQAVRRESWPTCKKEIEQVISTLRQVSERLKQQGLGQDLGSIRKAFPDLNEDFEAYFKCLDFDFNHECQLGLQRYATQLQKLGRLPQDSNLLSQLSPLDI